MQFKINIVFFIVPNIVIHIPSWFSHHRDWNATPTAPFPSLYFLRSPPSPWHGGLSPSQPGNYYLSAVIWSVVKVCWTRANRLAFLFTPPVRWHWQGKLMRAFKVACHSNVWLQFLIWAARKLSRAFTLYVELGRAKNINSEEMNVTTDLGWTLTRTLILLVKPSISDESHSKKKHKCRFLRKKTCYGGYLCLFSPVRKSSERLESSSNMSAFFPKRGVRGRRKQAFLPRICLRDETCRPLKFYGSAVVTHHSGSIINSCAQTDNAECW